MKHKLVRAIRQNDGIGEYEAHLKALQNGARTLSMPNKIGHEGALGRSISLAQLLATWGENSERREIQTWLKVDNTDNIQRFSSTVHGLAATYYAESILGVGGRTNLKGSLLQAAAPRIRSMNRREYTEVSQGRLTELIFIHRARHQFHSATYRKQPSHAEIMDRRRHGSLIVSAREMNALFSNIVKAQKTSRNDAKHIAPLLDANEMPVGNLMHEIFRNAAEYAYLSLDNKIPSKGLRCILIAHRLVNLEILHPDFLVSGKHPNLRESFDELCDHVGRGSRRRAHILELSFLDTGPGFAATIRTKTQSEDEDADLVASCFEESITCKPGPNSGLGLSRVLRHVNKLKGFLRLRTSSTEAFYSPLCHSQTCANTPSVVGNLPEVTGTALTIAIPLPAQ